MGLFDEIEGKPEAPEEGVLVANQDPLPEPVAAPETADEVILMARQTAQDIEREEGPTTKQVIAGLTAEIAISGGGQAASAAAAGGTAATLVGAAAAPFVWVGGTFSSGYAGSVAAQKIEGRDNVSQGRALFAGLVNTIPFLGKAKQGSKLAKLTKQLGSHAAQGAAIGAGETTSVAVIDEGRLPTLKELGFGAGGGAVIGTALGGTIEVGKVLAPKTVEVFKKISGKNASEIDVMVAKGDVLTEDIAEAMEDIAEAPKPKQAEAPKETPEAPAEPTPAPKTLSSEEAQALIKPSEKEGKNIRTLGKGDWILERTQLSDIRANEKGDLYDDTVDYARASEYAKRDTEFPPIILATTKDGRLNVSDGGHRISAARMRGDETILTLRKKTKEAPAEPTPAPKTRTEDGNDFAPDVEDTISRAGFNPDTFWRRPEYAQRAIDDMRRDIEIINNPQDKDSIAFEKAIKAIEETQTPKAPAEPTPAPKTPKTDPIDESIAAVKGILEGDRTGGKGARVTRKAKKHFRAVAREFFDDINTLIKTKDVEVAKKILGRIDKYIEFDRIMSEKDYAQGSELQANTRNAMDNGVTDYSAGISAAANERTANLQVLKGMLEKFGDEGAEVSEEVLKKAKSDTGKSAKGAPKLSKEEKLDAIADQVAKTFTKSRNGVLQQAYDAYFNTRLVQMLNQAKTAFVGVPSAAMMSVVRPLINTPYNIAKAAKMEGKPVSRRIQYATADLAATYEYVRMVSKHLKDALKSAVDTTFNKGDSNFLYRDRNAYLKDELASANEPTHAVKRRLKQAERRVATREAETPLGKVVLGAREKAMNNKLTQFGSFLFDAGVSLIGGVEEISLIAHSMRAARAKGIKKAIDEGAEDVWKASEDYMNGAIDRSRGGIQANYDPEYADVFNTARRDHFRAMDLDPNDIRRDLVDGMVGGLAKISSNPDEIGTLAKMLFVFIGVPLRALREGTSYIVSPLRVATTPLGRGAAAFEKSLGGTATFGKYNNKLSKLEMDMKGQKKLLKSKDPEVAKAAEKKLAELEESHAFTKDLQMQEDYEALGKLAVGAGLFFMGYEMAKNGQVAGTDAWMTEEQKLASQKVQGAPNSWKVVMGGNEFDFRYFDPLKGVFALGADWARRQAAKEAGALTEDQTFTQFVTSVSRSIATDSPFATGARYVTQLMSPNPETQERGAMGIGRSMIPVPAEIRNFNKFDEEFVTDTTTGEGFETALKASLGRETGNYRLTSLGEPKLKEEPSLVSYVIPFGPKAVPEREPIDDILLEDAMSFRSISDVPTSVRGFKLKNYVNEDNETLYSLFGRLITETRIGGKSQRQALNALVKTGDFKRAYKKGYEQNEQGSEVNEGIEMIKEVIQKYRAAARKKLIESKAGADYTDSEGNNIYDVMREREAYSERPDSLLDTLNLP